MTQLQLLWHQTIPQVAILQVGTPPLPQHALLALVAMQRACSLPERDPDALAMLHVRVRHIKANILI
jgi:hypothetical protein